MPGARARRMVTISSMAAATAEISAKVTPSSQKSAPAPEYGVLDSGVYMNQPASGGVPTSRLLSSSVPPST
jgi:hypothetical protein